MFYRSLGLSRWLTAWMLICFIAPQDVCLSCLVTRLAASDRVEDTYCDCCGVVGAMDETGDDYGSPIQIPYDDSNCPSCIMKSMGIILNPAVEVQTSARRIQCVLRRTELRSSSFRLQTCGIRKTARLQTRIRSFICAFERSLTVSTFYGVSDCLDVGWMWTK